MTSKPVTLPQHHKVKCTTKYSKYTVKTTQNSAESYYCSKLPPAQYKVHCDHTGEPFLFHIIPLHNMKYIVSSSRGLMIITYSAKLPHQRHKPFAFAYCTLQNIVSPSSSKIRLKKEAKLAVTVLFALNHRDVHGQNISVYQQILRKKMRTET